MGIGLYLLVLASMAFRASRLSDATVLPTPPQRGKSLAHFPAPSCFPPGVSLAAGGAPIRNSPKLTSLKSLLYQHDSPKAYTGVLRFLADAGRPNLSHWFLLPPPNLLTLSTRYSVFYSMGSLGWALPSQCLHTS